MSDETLVYKYKQKNDTWRTFQIKKLYIWKQYRYIIILEKYLQFSPKCRDGLEGISSETRQQPCRPCGGCGVSISGT